MRLVWTAVGFAVLLGLPFAIWGEDFMRWFTGDAALASDLFLPLPATPVMSAAGYL